MSLRTKLLAAVVGLPVAILLICIVLLVRRDNQTFSTVETLADIVNASRGGSVRDLGRLVVEAEERGELEDTHLVRYARTDTIESEDDFWRASTYFAPTTTRLTPGDIEDPRVQKDLLAAVELLSLERPWRLIDGELAVLSAAKTRGRTFALVGQISDTRGVARQLYLIVGAGAVLTALLGWWLVTKLVTVPLGRLAATADAIAAGRAVEPIPAARNPDEFGRTIRALNRMGTEIRAYQEEMEDRVLEGLERIERTEQHLLIAQRLAATGKLAAGLAHEINNPLGGMKNAVQALARGDLSEDKTAQYLDLVNEGLGRLELMVKRFLSFTPRRVDPRAADLVEVVEKSLALADHRVRAEGIVVRPLLPAHGEAVVFGDPAELQQAVLNLVLNAVDALRGRAGACVEVAVTTRDYEVVVRVADNGPGIPPEDQDRCFDMFFTTKEVGEGTGMGLALAHTIVTNHGGSIQLVSPPGEGATFLLYLPLHAEAVATDAEQTSPRTP